MDCSKKRIMVSGSEGQLGRAISQSLKERECEVVGVDLEKKTTNEFLSTYYSVNVTDESSVVKLFEEESSIDCLINNAGIGVFTPTLERTVEEFRAVMDVNLLGTFLMSQKFIISRKSGGRIVNIASMYGHISSDFRIYGNSGRNNSEVYTATKAGVVALTKYLAANFSHSEFIVNSISPGGIFNSQSEDFLTAYMDKSPQKRLCNVQEVADVVRYFSLDSPSHLTGEDILIDGGFTKW